MYDILKIVFYHLFFDMSSKQNVLAVAIVTLIVVFIAGYAYDRISMSDPSQTINNQTADNVPEVKVSLDASIKSDPVPETPDAVVDALLQDAAFDDTTMNSALQNEQESVSESGKNINQLTQTYDENQL